MNNLRLRLPDDVKAWLETDAQRHERSQNGHLIWVLRQRMTAEAAQATIELDYADYLLPDAARLLRGYVEVG